MRTRLILLIIICVLIPAVIVFSVFYYKRGRQDQFDEYILKHSKLENEPGFGPVDPAIVKAIIAIRTDFTRFRTGSNGEKGLMFIPVEGVEKFIEFHGHENFIVRNLENELELGYVCLNRSFPNHDGAEKVFSRSGNCPVCGRATVRAIFDWETNIQIGIWYLAYVTEYLREITEDLDDEQLTYYAIVSYSYGLEMIEKASRGFTDFEQLDRLLKDEAKNIERIKEKADEFRPRLKKKAQKLENRPSHTGGS